MGIVRRPRFEPVIGDVDDHRPNTSWAIVTDRDVNGLTVIIEDIAPGDRIPLHTHPSEEALIVASGAPRVRVGRDQHVVGPGAVMLVPAGTPHGARNETDEVVRVHAVFPTRRIGITYLERNPAPGTWAHPPQPPFELDLTEER